jgi:hypothetical protein
MKAIGAFAVGLGLLIGGAHVAKADDCLEIGMNNREGQWEWYHAWIDNMTGDHVHIKYDHHHGELELKVSEKDKPDGQDVVMLRGRWFEGREASRSGHVFLRMEKGHHHAKGWYTFGDDEGVEHKDVELRDCKRHY